MTKTPTAEPTTLRRFLGALGRHAADLGKIFLGELVQFLIQVAVPACLLIALAGGFRAAADSAVESRFLYFDTEHMIEKIPFRVIAIVEESAHTDGRGQRR